MQQQEVQRPQLTCKTMFVLGAMNMIDCINVNLLTPYVDRMISNFLDVDPDDPRVARLVGLLIGLYSLCEVCFSVVWGTLADRIGRKPALMIGLGGSVIAPIMFGLGTNLTVVFLARALDGFFCGNMGVTRTYMGEIVDETNEARGFSFLAVCFSLGLFIGPILGVNWCTPRILRRQSSKTQSFYMGWSFTILSQLLFPVYGIFADPGRYHGWRYVPLCFMQFVGAIGGGFLFPTAFALINRAAAGLEKGAVNGWANSSGALCRAVFPPAAGWILGWSSKSSVELLRYTAVYINCFVGTALLLIAAPGMHKTERQSFRRQQSQQQEPRGRRSGAASSGATEEAAQHAQPLVKE